MASFDQELSTPIEKEIWIYNDSEKRDQLREKVQNILKEYLVVATNNFGHPKLLDEGATTYLMKTDYVVIVDGFRNSSIQLNDREIKLFFEATKDTNLFILFDEKDDSSYIESLREGYDDVMCGFYKSDSSGNNVCEVLCTKILQHVSEVKGREDIKTYSHIFDVDTENVYGGDNTEFHLAYCVDINKTNKLNIIHQNIDGLISKLELLNSKIKETETNDGIELDVLCFTETNLINDDLKTVKITNYQYANSSSLDKRSHGCGIWVRLNESKKPKYDFRRLNFKHEKKDKDLPNCCAIKLISLNVIIICVYRPPRSSRALLNELYFQLMENLKKYNKKHNNYKIIICGDFNINILVNDSVAKKFKKFIKDYDMLFAFNTPTRPASKTCVDNIIHNYVNCSSRRIDLGLSDHWGQLISVPIEENTNVKAGSSRNDTLSEDSDEEIILDLDKTYLIKNDNVFENV